MERENAGKDRKLLVSDLGRGGRDDLLTEGKSDSLPEHIC